MTWTSAKSLSKKTKIISNSYKRGGSIKQNVWGIFWDTDFFWTSTFFFFFGKILNPHTEAQNRLRVFSCFLRVTRVCVSGIEKNYDGTPLLWELLFHKTLDISIFKRLFNFFQNFFLKFVPRFFLVQDFFLENYKTSSNVHKRECFIKQI